LAERKEKLRPATDPNINYKTLVQQGYDRCAQAYFDARRGETSPELELLIRRLPAGAHILDIGCGAGMPVTCMLAPQFQVTGVDISGEQIRLARQNVPAATFLQADIMSLDFPPATFDAVVSYYTIFHLPREEHPVLFERIRRWLKPGGFLMATLTRHAEAAYTEDDFFGVTMYWCNYGLEDYLQIIASQGYHLLEAAVISHGYRNLPDQPAERHPWIFAQV
jgi:cyclopropane fatty-acyl-phospholipid synthase-like methyltransferase